MGFKVGDVVKVVDDDGVYTNFVSFFDYYKEEILSAGIKLSQIARFYYTAQFNIDTLQSYNWTIKFIGKHPNRFFDDTTICLLVDNDLNNNLILIENNDSYLQYTAREMTLEEIEKELGYKVQLKEG